MPPIMNRRSSLAISALLNNESIEPRMMASAATNRQSGSVSPATTNSNMDSGDTTPISSIVSSKTNGTSNGIVNSSQLSRHKRKRTTPAQFTRLMEIFDQTDTPSSEVRKNLATELNMDEREVQVRLQTWVIKLDIHSYT
ncbi:hypothetical protein BDF20DRAFT_850852 [Mycotypha africana]|uniref:uncharacterized protein n=1 Tax=Mycotypha africana TaxID=64632 RepID=UPI0023001A5D|nr:uncharacterized protein BDF20DRAFT_850852 [Mycotypha africana]KAI8987549.1 hypothetical protein BDF20DRAFT_850852 [Mycotypha africana]